jgi:hypothetical protein
MVAVPIREAALAAVETRLRLALPGIAVERARRAPVDIDRETLPRLIVSEDGWQGDATQSPSALHATLGIAVQGLVTAASDLACDQALSTLHARVVAALAGYTPPDLGLADIAEQDSDFALLDAEDSLRPAGEFTARFALLTITQE